MENSKKMIEAEKKLQADAEKAKEDIKKHVEHIKAKADATGHDMMQIVEFAYRRQLKFLQQKQLNHIGENTTQNAATQQILDTPVGRVRMIQNACYETQGEMMDVKDYKAPSWDVDSIRFIPTPIPLDSYWFGTIHDAHKIHGLKLVREFGHFQQAQGIAVNQDGLIAVVDTIAKKTEVFQSNGDEYESMFCLISKHDAKITQYSVCVGADGNFYITGSGVSIFSQLGKYLRSMPMKISPGSIAALPDGSMITGNSPTKTITIWKSQNGEVIKTYNTKETIFSNIVSDGKQIVYTTGTNGKVRAIDFKTGQAMWEIDLAETNGICYGYNSDTLLISGGSSKKGEHVIEQYSSATGRLMSRLAMPTGLYWPFSMAISHDGKLLVADKRSVKVYEIQ